jgi:hypothetical protein
LRTGSRVRDETKLRENARLIRSGKKTTPGAQIARSRGFACRAR